MNTEIIKINELNMDAAALRRLIYAGNIIKKGGLVVFPTETVYGIGADAFNKEASSKIYAAKGRPSDNPLIVHIARLSSLDRLCVFKDDVQRKKALRLAEKFWPGPLTLILPKCKDLPKETSGGLDTVAVRFPSNKIARKLIELGGGFIAAPSANLSGRPSPTDASHCIEDMNGRVDLIIESGDAEIGLESTIVDLSVEASCVLRPGVITAAEIFEALSMTEGKKGEDSEELSAAEHPKAPGMKYRHYAPKGRLVIYSGMEDRVISGINKAVSEVKNKKKTAVITAKESAACYAADIVKIAGARHDGEEIAHNLFRILRELDDEGAEVIFSEAFYNNKRSEAIMNRLIKAAGGEIIEL